MQQELAYMEEREYLPLLSLARQMARHFLPLYHERLNKIVELEDLEAYYILQIQ